uniref:Uncharacterized protein n=1 Tax=Peromyscus maniculatus bairdii TaxID=230844 RepID=A0A8C8UI12_PERMB
MKFQILTWCLLSDSDPHRLIPSNILYIRHIYSILISNTYLQRCKLWMTSPLHTHKWSLHILYLSMPSYRMRDLLWLIYLHRNITHWNHSITYHYSNSS